MKRTVIDMFEETATKYAARPAYYVKKNGTYTPTDWATYFKNVQTVAKAFIKLGMQAGDGCALIGYNCPQWFTANEAAIYVGAIPAGIYTTNSPEQCHFIAHDCKASIAVVENAEQLAKFKAIRQELPALKAIVMMEGSDADPDVHSWEDVVKMGEAENSEELEARRRQLNPDDVCTLIYTSGTTGNPKGVMLTHDNIVWTVGTLVKTVEGNEYDRFISYLPLSHIAEQVVSLYSPMAVGASSWFAESLEQLGENLREVRPTIFVGVPRVWEKIQAKMQAMGAQAPALRKKLVTWAKKHGLEGGYAEQQGKSKTLWYKIADKVIFSKVREKLGLDQARLCITSAAPISRDTLEFFLSLGVRICEVYGMSECTGPGTISLANRYKTGKVGFPMEGQEVKIAKDGEILMRGRHIAKGYLNRPDATAEAFNEDGWLHSGDIGVIDEDGFLQITDRKKDLIITAGGENIAPQLLEGKLKAIQVVSQAVVIGDRRKYLSCLLTIDEEKYSTAKESSGSSASSLHELTQCPKFKDYIQKEIEAVNKDLARVQTIKKFSILPNDFTIEGGELTPTMKVKRKIVNEKYQDVIESMY